MNIIVQLVEATVHCVLCICNYSALTQRGDINRHWTHNHTPQADSISQVYVALLEGLLNKPLVAPRVPNTEHMDVFTPRSPAVQLSAAARPGGSVVLSLVS